MCEGANLSAEVDYSKVPLIEGIKFYLDQFIYPDMTMRNFQSYSAKVSTLTGEQLFTLCDPQTSGGLLIAVNPMGKNEFLSICSQFGLELNAIGGMVEKEEKVIRVV
jgi:selenide,water dikinase